METRKPVEQSPATEPRVADGREYLVTTPDGASCVAHTLAEAIVIADLWRTRQPSISCGTGAERRRG